MKNRDNILASTSTFGKFSNKHIIKIQKDYNLIINPKNKKLSEQELISLLNEYQPIGLLAGTEKISKKTLNSAKNYLRIISRVGVGYDNINLNYANEIGIKVFRTAGVLNHSVAELTIGLILCSLRKIIQSNNSIIEGKWEKADGNLLKGKTVGIIGLGEIGETVRVTTGPFADFNGIIEEINLDQSKVTVLVNIFGRETPVELGFTDIVKN